MWIDEEGYIQTPLYKKLCWVISYLLPSSCHPSFICKNVPYSLGFRLVRIESTREGIEKNLVKLEEELTSQGYRKASVTAALLRARQLNRPHINQELKAD